MERDLLTPPTSDRAVKGLAVVGFIALIGMGVWLAVYTTKYIPSIVNGLAAAAVYIGSTLSPSSPGLTVVPTPATTISFGPPASSTSSAPKATAPKATPTGASQSSNTTYEIGAPSSTVTPHGLADLAVTIDATGYLATASTDSFVATSTVISGNRPAVKFTIKNIGTNWTGTWRFNVDIPIGTAYTFHSDPQLSLAPDESIDYILGFDRARIGENQLITVTANSDNTVLESNYNNDSASTYITVVSRF